MICFLIILLLFLLLRLHMPILSLWWGQHIAVCYGTSSQFPIQECCISSLKLTLAVVFAPRKWAQAISQGFGCFLRESVANRLLGKS